MLMHDRIPAIRRLVEQSGGALFAFDRAGRVVVFSEACERLTGYSADEVLGRSAGGEGGSAQGEDRPSSLAGLLRPESRVFNGNPREPLPRRSLCIRRKDGADVWVESTYDVMRDADGNVECVFGVLRAAEGHIAAAQRLDADEMEAIRAETRRLAEAQQARFGFSNVVSRCPEMLAVFEKVRAARTNSSAVLISGESGTGKEVIARTIHDHGLQSGGPFIPLNCSALPRDLIESELFGHAKGAFTGAVQDYRGLLRAAEGGTVFLDEIGAMPLETQAKLLRAVQDKRVRPVGSATEIPVRARIISALNQPPREAIAVGRLREDLFYRLSVIGIELPRLADRAEDIPLLVLAFMDELNQTSLRRVDRVAPDVWPALRAYGWPGNVRELSNVIESAFALGAGPVLRKEDLPAEIQSGGAGRPANGAVRAEGHPDESLRLDPALARAEREAILRALRAAGGQRSRAAALLGISRSRLYRRMEALGMDVQATR